MSLKNDIVELLQHNRNNILQGKINCIPSPFPRFRFDFPGVRPKTYYLISGATKSSKTQFTQYVFVFNTIIYWLEHPDKISKPKIFIFHLEEDKIDITMRFYCYLYYKICHQRFSPLAMQSIDADHPIPQEVIDKIKNDPIFAKYINAFDECVEFREERHPTGIYMVVKDYMEKHGKVIFKDEAVTYTDELGIKHENEVQRTFDKYIPDDEFQYVIPIVDHVGLLQVERGLNSLKDAIETLSSYFVMLRNRYNVSPVVVQQQNTESTNLQAVQANRIMPTKDGLKDSKRTGEDCTVFIGIVNPWSFRLQSYSQFKYNVNRLRDHFRLIEIVLNRTGKANGLCPLYFDGAVNNFAELPRVNDAGMEQVYRYAEGLNSSLSFFMHNFTKTKPMLNKGILWNIKEHFKYLCK